jgi:hypothetical protein
MPGSLLGVVNLRRLRWSGSCRATLVAVKRDMKRVVFGKERDLAQSLGSLVSDGKIVCISVSITCRASSDALTTCWSRQVALVPMESC